MVGLLGMPSFCTKLHCIHYFLDHTVKETLLKGHEIALLLRKGLTNATKMSFAQVLLRAYFIGLGTQF